MPFPPVKNASKLNYIDLNLNFYPPRTKNLCHWGYHEIPKQSPFSHVFGDKPIATRFVLTCVLGMNREARDSTIAIPASLDFDIIPVIGDAEVSSDSIPTYIFTYEVIDTNYIIEFSIIPKSTGYFKIFTISLMVRLKTIVNAAIH